MLLALERWLCRYNAELHRRLRYIDPGARVTCVRRPLDILYDGRRYAPRPWVLVAYKQPDPSEARVYDVVVLYARRVSARDGAQAILKRVYSALRWTYHGATP